MCQPASFLRDQTAGWDRGVGEGTEKMEEMLPLLQAPVNL